MHGMINVPESCIELLTLHRTEYQGLAPVTIELAHYLDLVAAFESFRAYLPTRGGPIRILDIGAGLAGIDVLLLRHFGARAEVVLADRNAPTRGDKYSRRGFHPEAATFAAYCDFDLTRAFLAANGIEQGVRFVDLEREPFPTERFDLVVSLLSWGFHYPVDTYEPDADLLVLDMRRGTTELLTLARRGYHGLACHEGRSSRRIIAWRET